MVWIGETSRNRTREPLRRRPLSWRKMAAHALCQPLRNSADVECGGGYSRRCGRRADRPKWLRPHTRHDEQIDSAVELRHVVWREPSGELDLQIVIRARREPATPLLPSFSVGTITGERDMDRLRNLRGQIRQCIKEQQSAFQIVHAAGKEQMPGARIVSWCAHRAMHG